MTTIEKSLEMASNNTPYFKFDGCTKLAKVVDVYDGDTLRACFSIDDTDKNIYKYNVRLYGYDSEEIRQPKNAALREEKKQLAYKHKKALEEMTLNKLVYLECMGYDKYGRLLGKVFLDSEKTQCVNTIMVDSVGCKPYIV